MKITKELLRKIIKEELAGMEQEGREVGYHLAYDRRKPKMDPAAEKQRDLKFSGANILSTLLNPIVGDGNTNPADDGKVESVVNMATDGKDPADIAAIVDFVKTSIPARADMIKNNPELKGAFDETVSKLMKALENKAGGTPKLEQAVQVNERLRIKLK